MVGFTGKAIGAAMQICFHHMRGIYGSQQPHFLRHFGQFDFIDYDVCSDQVITGKFGLKVR